MLEGRKVVVILPAYNAERTLRKTYEELPLEYVDDVVLVDDASRDGTAAPHGSQISTIIHQDNKGCGANQKTCYRKH
jgi:glycosyltransferase involved in cell wall biosynthesis